MAARRLEAAKTRCARTIERNDPESARKRVSCTAKPSSISCLAVIRGRNSFRVRTFLHRAIEHERGPDVSFR